MMAGRATLRFGGRCCTQKGLKYMPHGVVLRHSYYAVLITRCEVLHGKCLSLKGMGYAFIAYIKSSHAQFCTLHSHITQHRCWACNTLATRLSHPPQTKKGSKSIPPKHIKQKIRPPVNAKLT